MMNFFKYGSMAVAGFMVIQPLVVNIKDTPKQ